ncbi:sugar-transfer associated ATP-grasp domain-containing protein [Halobacterium sp. MBLA0001]|uniref:sugar-transfer associated ATP-grasp domain-containing protein n=1 Tax=Halobacterium sp. MBLA0001 TaxID=3413511 RepID=UPI003C771D90
MSMLTQAYSTFKETHLVHLLSAGFSEVSPKISKILYLLDKEYSTAPGFPMPISRRLWLWRHGFLSRSGAIFNLTDDNIGEYVSNYEQRMKLSQINDNNRAILENKIVFHRILSDISPYAPPDLAVIKNNALYPLSTGERQDPVDWVLSTLQNDKELILKPTTTSSGKGILKLVNTEKSFTVNSEYKRKSEISQIIEELDEYLVSRAVQQREYANTIFPDSVNTIRVITMLDPETGEAFSPAAVHRFGSTESAPTDNWGQGGYCAEVDQDTGELSKATTVPDGSVQSWYSKHPDTGAQIEGASIPEWETVFQEVLSLAERIPYVPYVGWDIVLTDGAFVILEGNALPGIETLQSHSSLKSSQRVRNFYQHHC